MGGFLGGGWGGGVSVLLKRDWVNSIHYQFRHKNFTALSQNDHIASVESSMIKIIDIIFLNIMMQKCASEPRFSFRLENPKEEFKGKSEAVT